MKTQIFLTKIFHFSLNWSTRSLRFLFEVLRIDILSKPYGVESIDYHYNLLKHIDFESGFFVELGGYDGFFHSPTYYLEKFKGWQGILIEPHPVFYKRCVKNRAQSKVFNYACSSDSINKSLVLNSIGHSSYIKGSIDNEDFFKEGLDQIYQKQSEYEVETASLTSILDSYLETNIFKDFNLLVIDVEGFELNVLKGLDFTIYKPQFILCESRSIDEKEIIEKYLINFGYKFHDRISHQDYLYKFNK
jgi:FkbM family methyltransferase